MTDTAKILAILRDAAERGNPCPADWRMGAAAGFKEQGARLAIQQLVRDGLVVVEKRGRDRRAVFPDGVATDWTDRTPGGSRYDLIVRPEPEPLPVIPPDTRDLTSRICGDSMIQREHETWTPVYTDDPYAKPVTLPRLSFLDGASA